MAFDIAPIIIGGMHGRCNGAVPLSCTRAAFHHNTCIASPDFVRYWQACVIGRWLFSLNKIKAAKALLDMYYLFTDSAVYLKFMLTDIKCRFQLSLFLVKIHLLLSLNLAKSRSIIQIIAVTETLIGQIFFREPPFGARR